MTTRTARISAIRQAARVRRMFGQSAQHRVVDGQHQVIVRGKVYVGKDIDEALQRAKEGKE
jgi:hypothetical protein